MNQIPNIEETNTREVEEQTENTNPIHACKPNSCRRCGVNINPWATRCAMCDEIETRYFSWPVFGGILFLVMWGILLAYLLN